MIERNLRERTRTHAQHRCDAISARFSDELAWIDIVMRGQNPAAVGEAIDAVQRLVAETAK